MLTGFGTGSGEAVQTLIDRVHEEVNCQALIPADREQEPFGRYVRVQCLNPEHTDQNPTMLVFEDGANCSACGWKGDAIDLYRLFHPEASVREACVALLENPELAMTGEASAPRQERTLDPDLAVKNHFALASNSAALAELMGFGFTPQAIKHFRLGYARVLVRLKPEDYERVDGAPDIEWRTIKGKQTAFQWQMRFAVPVFVEGRLRQVIYRKTAAYEFGEKVTMERDAGSHLFRADDLADTGTAVVCEGWGDAIVCWQWGIVAVTSTNGAGHWTAEWNELLGNVRRLYVVADADTAGDKMVKRIKRDIPWARRLTLPWSANSKMDLRDGWLAGWRRADVLKLLRQADIAASWSIATGGAT